MTMRISLLALTALTALAATNMTPAEARGGRAVCLHGAQTGSVYDCSYDSIAQCNATLSGTYGSCDVNPEYLARGYDPRLAYDQQYSPAPPPRRRARYNSDY